MVQLPDIRVKISNHELSLKFTQWYIILNAENTRFVSNSRENRNRESSWGMIIRWAWAGGLAIRQVTDKWLQVRSLKLVTSWGDLEDNGWLVLVTKQFGSGSDQGAPWANRGNPPNPDQLLHHFHQQPVNFQIPTCQVVNFNILTQLKYEGHD